MNKRKRLKTRIIFTQEDINRVLFNLPKMSIVIGEFISLRKSGSDHVGRCPLCKNLTHNDSHLRVSDRKGIYKCFECSRGGSTSVSFIMMYYNIPFDKALVFLNKKYTKMDLVPNRIRSPKRSYIDDNLPF